MSTISTFLTTHVVKRPIRTIVGIASAAYTFHNYKSSGIGYAGILGLANANPVVMSISRTAELFSSTGTYLFNKQQNKLQSSFKSNRINDKYNNIATMREVSSSKLVRDRNSPSRFLGNEAFYFHR